MSIDWIKCTYWRFLCLSLLPRILSLFLCLTANISSVGWTCKSTQAFHLFLPSALKFRPTPYLCTLQARNSTKPIDRPLSLPLSLLFSLILSLIPSFRSMLLDCPTNTKCQLLMVQARTEEQARLSGV